MSPSPSDGSMADDWKSLFAYWRGSPLERFEGGELPLEAFETADRANEPIGTAELQPDGSIVLDLRAEGEGGAIGHALLTVRPGDPVHAAVAAHLAGGGAEARSLGPVPFAPMKN